MYLHQQNFNIIKLTLLIYLSHFQISILIKMQDYLPMNLVHWPSNPLSARETY